ncbi:pilus assembly protein PilM, partial [bacterium]|nr:pilus assembly protein PilM [bacterium]
HLALLQSAGLNPLGVEVDTLSLISSLDYSSSFRAGEMVLLLEFGAGVTTLNIVVNNELYFTRNLAITGNSLTRAVSDYCNVAFPEAEQLKKAYGLTASDQKALQVKLALLPLLEHLVSDIKISRKHYQIAQSRVTKCDRLILSGGSSRLKELLSCLISRFNIEIANPLGKIKVSAQAKIDDLEEMAPRFSVALGLALRGMK